MGRFPFEQGLLAVTDGLVGPASALATALDVFGTASIHAPPLQSGLRHPQVGASLLGCELGRWRQGLDEVDQLRLDRRRGRRGQAAILDLRMGPGLITGSAFSGMAGILDGRKAL